MPNETPPLAFDAVEDAASRIVLGPRALLLRGFAVARAPELVAAIDAIAAVSPFRHMVVPGGWKMSVALTNCGQVGWVTDRTSYRYDAIGPKTGHPWAAMPQAFADLAAEISSTFVPMPAWSTVTRRARGCRFIRTATNVTSVNRSCPSRWACRRSFSGVAERGATRPGAFRYSMAMSWSGAARIA
jgi:hypothetical protein